jgi:hypothetical protein
LVGSEIGESEISSGSGNRSWAVENEKILLLGLKSCDIGTIWIEVKHSRDNYQEAEYSSDEVEWSFNFDMKIGNIP